MSAEITIPPRAFCHQCGRETETAVFRLKSGHWANACRDCRACRKSRPYVSRMAAEIFCYENSQRPTRAKGIHEQPHR